ncbi:uncharacterized protein PAC_18042 [Phialocephala subalpina]|uniref:Uncharacterized protein n=1 Tax=Phialocephala subalpina TaxID=576137 RepID=A0A1L7XSX7_9HELO|nr:uncharacterized protein PAC_18042 [Phialocephala subalpina]
MSSLSPLLPDYLPGKFIPARSGDEDVYENVQLNRLCTWCESIKDWVKENLPKAQREYENGNYTFDARVGVTLRSEVHPTGNELLLSGRKGCHLCSMMWYSVQGHMDRKGLELRERREQKFYGIYMDVYSSTSSSMPHGPRLLVDVGLYDRSRPSYEDLDEGLNVEFGQYFLDHY